MSGLDAVIKRIQKLRRLSESPNVHEAALAAAEAQRLMTEHRIAEASLGEGATDEPVVNEDILREMGRRQVQSWEIELASGVARANGCRIYKRGKRFARGYYQATPGGLHLVGRKQDVDATKYLFLLFRGEISRMADLWAAARGEVRTTEKTSFKYGAAVAVEARLGEEERKAASQLKAASDLGHAGASTALVVFNKAVVKAQEEVTRICGGKVHRPAGLSSLDAFHDGKRAGEGMDLGQGKKRLGEGARRLGSGS